jgi:protein O-GlcNAc transferase
MSDDESLYRRMVQNQPQNADAWHMLGLTLFRQNQIPESIEAITKAISLDSNRADYQHNLGLVLANSGDMPGAMRAFEKAAQLDPADPDALMQIGNLHAAMHQTELAAQAYANAVARRPDFDDALNNLGMTLKDLGRVEEALFSFEQILARNPNHVIADSNRVYTLHFHLDDPEAILAQHRIWNQRHAQPLANQIKNHPNDRDPHRRLRIGYVSPDFNQHVQVLYTIPLLSSHDHKNFEIFCYADVPRPDGYTQLIHQYADVWRPTVGKTDAEIAQMVSEDRIDILVDLTMHMSRGRPLVFARKPAPVQIAWLAYPSTTGVEAIDYRLTDPYLDPGNARDQFYSEKSIRLSETFWCFNPLTDGPAMQPLPALRNGYVTFGSLNNFCKINDPLLRIWAQVLNGVPRSRLISLAPEGTARQRVLEVTGLHPDRVTFVPLQPRDKYLETYHLIDLGLDTYPYNGHTSSLDSNWMGVPVISLMGKSAVSRAGFSQASNLGLTNLVARTPEEFVKIAISIAADLTHLATIRAGLRAKMEKSPLMDKERFVRNIESVYRDLWRQWCSG